MGEFSRDISIANQSQAMPSTVIVSLIIAIIVIAVSAIFLFSNITKTREESLSSVPEEGELYSSQAVSSIVNEQNCKNKCFVAQEKAKFSKKNDFCSDNGMVAELDFCNPVLCDSVYAKNKKLLQCVLTFKNDGNNIETSVLRCRGTTSVC